MAAAFSATISVGALVFPDVIVGMIALRGWMGRRSVPYVVVFLSLYGTVMSLPYVAMFYGFHDRYAGPFL